MNLTSLSIRRPVLATVMSLTIVLFGLIAYSFLGVREYPAVEPSVVTVRTDYPGANARVVEAQITTPLEESINAVAGIDTLTSVSNDGRSTVVAEFRLGIDLESAANDVRDRVSRAVRFLPPDAEPPIVIKADADSMPIIGLSVSSTLRSLLELTALADTQIKPRLETIPGISEVNIWGAKEYAMRLWLDPQLLTAYGITPVDVRQALAGANVELPTGRIEGLDTELTVRTLSRLESVEEFNDLVILREGDSLVRLRDVGRAELGALNERTVLKRDGIPMVIVVLRPQPGANHIDIADEFYLRMDRIGADLPDDISLAIGFDSTEYIRASIAEVRQTIFVALTLVVMVIFLFLREWRTTLIPAIVIPISLIGAFFVMFAAGFSINVLTLLAIVLAIGLVVDDAIVVLENIYSKMERGMAPAAAGIAGVREIFLAVIATTVSLVTVFLPLLFLGGLTGRLFREFGMVLAGAVVISSFVALTLTPMLSTRLLKGHTGTGRFHRRTEPFFARLNEGYRSWLGAFLTRPWLALPVLVAAVGLIVLLFRALPSELAPLEDRGEILVRASAPEGRNFEYMSEVMNRIDAVVLDELREYERDNITSITSPGFGAATSVNSGQVRIRLVDASQRERSQSEIASALNRRLRELPGARISVSEPPSIGGRRAGLPVQFVIQARTLEQLEEILPEFLQSARDDPAFSFVDADLKFDKPEVRIAIDRNRARVLGVSVLKIAETLQAALSGQRFGFFLLDGRQYQVVGQLERDFRATPFDLTQVAVRSENGRLITLDNLIEISEAAGPPQLYRFDRLASATISANLNNGYTIGDGIAAMRTLAGELLDETYTTALAGQSREFEQSAASLGFVFAFALVLVYLVLAAQFESFRDPFTIMLTVPLALAGALFSLWFFRETLNIFSQIGLIMLIGLVTKNGILLVEFANQRKRAGLSVAEAALDAAAARFRPILMTTCSTILGILPIALAVGAGAQSRVSMGVAIIGGLIVGAALTLFVIPAIYSLVTPELTEEDIALLKGESSEPESTPSRENTREPAAAGQA
ncbi:MAG: efflux RND transporter permease subunit [Puniceicoccaceae bacterium]|nr:MAG: efflux RND transporter permease subunit [Puniceicoccaceae bacterium]